MAGGGFGTAQPGQPQQPGLVQAGQGGFGQGAPFQRPLPEGYQSPYANYGFDSGFQSYLDNQYLGSMSDAGVNYQYDPTNQTFTGGTMGGRYNPIPLSVMQQAAGGNRDVLNPYFQSRFQQTQPTPTFRTKPDQYAGTIYEGTGGPGAPPPQVQQPTTPPPTVKPGMDINQIKEMYRGQPRPMQPQGPQRPFNPRPFPGQGNDIRRGPMSPQIQQPVDPRRSGLGALPGLNGVPGNQNPLYFGPGYK